MASPDNFDSLSKIQPAPGVADSLGQGLDVGMKLATMKDTVEQKKMQTQAMAQELSMKKFDSLTKMTQTYLRSGDKTRKLMQKQMEETARRHDLNLPAGWFDAVATDPHLATGMQNIIKTYQEGKLTPEEAQSAIDAAGDLGMFGDVLGQFGKNNAADQKAELAEAARAAAETRAAAAQVNKDRDYELKKDAEKRRGVGVTGKAMVDSKKEVDTLLKDDYKRLDQTKNAITMLSGNNPIASEAVKGALARISGEVGVLTDTDIKRFGGSQDLGNRMASYLKKNAEGTLTEADRGNMKALVLEYAKVLNNKARDVSNRTAESRAKAHAELGLTKEDFLEAINIDSVLFDSADPNGRPQQSAPAASGTLVDVGGGKKIDTSKGTKEDFMKWYPQVPITPEMKFKQ